MHYPISPREALKNLRTAIGACAPRCGLPYARHNKRPMRSWCRTNCENLMQITIAHRNPVAPLQRHLWAISNQLNHLESLYDSLACENVVASAHGARSSHVTVRAILGVSSSATPQASSTQRAIAAPARSETSKPCFSSLGTCPRAERCLAAAGTSEKKRRLPSVGSSAVRQLVSPRFRVVSYMDSV